MSGRQFRKLLFFALVIAVGYWIYKDRPTVSGIVDSLTNPLMGSKAAVKSAERNRVVGDASATIAEQSDLPVGSLREGMPKREVEELLGKPESIQDEVVDGVKQVRWVYARARREVVFRDNQVVSIVVR